MGQKLTENQLKGLLQDLNRGLTGPQTILKCKQALGELLSKPKRSRSKPKVTVSAD
jgi:hypothetical protein